jgi:hypothetical protein
MLRPLSRGRPPVHSVVTPFYVPNCRKQLPEHDAHGKTDQYYKRVAERHRNEIRGLKQCFDGRTPPAICKRADNSHLESGCGWMPLNCRCAYLASTDREFQWPVAMPRKISGANLMSNTNPEWRSRTAMLDNLRQLILRARPRKILQRSLSSTCTNGKHNFSFWLRPYALQHQMSFARIGKR